MGAGWGGGGERRQVGRGVWGGVIVSSLTPGKLALCNRTVLATWCRFP